MDMNENKILEAIEFVKKHSKADDFELIIAAADETYFRFGENRITQNGTGESTEVYLSSFFGSKKGMASGNVLDEENLLELIKTSEEIAKLNKNDPEYVASQVKMELPEVDNFSEATVNLSIEEIVSNIDKTIKRAEKEEVTTAGISNKHIIHTALATKNGFYGYDKYTAFTHSMTFFTKGRETKTEVSLKDYSIFDIDAELDKISEKLAALNSPKQSEKGKIAVILAPAAVHNYFEYLKYTLNRRSADLGMSCFSGKIGEKIFGEKFNFRSTVGEAGILTQKFGFSGVPAKSINWVKDGVLNELQVGRDWAKIKDLEPTTMCNWVIDGGDTTVEDMMKKVKRGLIINNFWYIRDVDKKNGIWTGLTRDGVNYFEDGEIKHSVTNLRFNEGHADMTKRILALGKQEQTSTGTKVPWMLVDDFNFVDVTSF